MWYVIERRPLAMHMQSTEEEAARTYVCFVNARTKTEALQAIRSLWDISIRLTQVQRISFPIVEENKRGGKVLYTPRHYLEYQLRKRKYARHGNMIIYKELHKETLVRLRETL